MQFKPERMPETEDILRAVAEKFKTLPLEKKSARLKEVALVCASRAALCQMEEEVASKAAESANEINEHWSKLRKRCKHYVIHKKLDKETKLNPYTECFICGMKNV